jgi:hypothetical protein
LCADFEARIAPVYRQQGLLPSKLDLKHMNREMYIVWQTWLRAIYPKRPVLLDVIWARERRRPLTRGKVKDTGVARL